MTEVCRLDEVPCQHCFPHFEGLAALIWEKALIRTRGQEVGYLVLFLATFCSLKLFQNKRLKRSENSVSTITTGVSLSRNKVPYPLVWTPCPRAA
jgi:hypothetical protein